MVSVAIPVAVMMVVVVVRTAAAWTFGTGIRCGRSRRSIRCCRGHDGKRNKDVELVVVVVVELTGGKDWMMCCLMCNTNKKHLNYAK